MASAWETAPAAMKGWACAAWLTGPMSSGGGWKSNRTMGAARGLRAGSGLRSNTNSRNYLDEWTPLEAESGDGCQYGDWRSRVRWLALWSGPDNWWIWYKWIPGALMDGSG